MPDTFQFPPRWRGPIILSSLIAVAAVAMTECHQGPSATVPVLPPEVGHVAPDFVLPDSSGSPHSLAAQRGRPVLLSFICGCGPCRQMIKGSVALHQQHPHVSLFAVTAMSPAEAKSFACSEQVSFPFL